MKMTPHSNSSYDSPETSRKAKRNRDRLDRADTLLVPYPTLLHEDWRTDKHGDSRSTATPAEPRDHETTDPQHTFICLTHRSEEYIGSACYKLKLIPNRS